MDGPSLSQRLNRGKERLEEVCLAVGLQKAGSITDDLQHGLVPSPPHTLLTAQVTGYGERGRDPGRAHGL